MDAKYKREGDISIVSISGFLEIEKAQSFRDVCKKQFHSQKVIFNMKEAHFVGSTGIHPFLETILFLAANNQKYIKLVGVKQEFLRLFQTMGLSEIDIFQDEESAIESFTS